MTCPSCGAANHADFSFCLQCGHPLAQSGQTVDIGGETRADMQPIGGGLPMEAGTMAMSVPEFDSPASSTPLGGSPSSGGATVQLRVEQGSVDEALISLDRPITIIGRRQGSDIVIHDTNVSRMHAQIRRDGSRLTIEDAGSSNGTIVNDERIEQPRDLKDGDVIRIGDAVFILEAQPTTGGYQTDLPPEGSTMAIDLDSPMTSLGGAPDFNPPALMSSPLSTPSTPPAPATPPQPAPAPAPASTYTPPPVLAAANQTSLSEGVLDEEDLSPPSLLTEAAHSAPAPYASPAPYVAPSPMPAPVPAPTPASAPQPVAPVASAPAVVPEATPQPSSPSGSTAATLASLRRELSEVGQDLTGFSSTLTALADRVERLELGLDTATSDLAAVADAIKGPDAAVLTELQGILADIDRAAEGPKLSDALVVLEQLAAQPRDIELLLRLSQQAGAIEGALRIHGRLVAAAPRLQATLARLTS
ncbi:MAG: FHA domain-containing protein [Chloroflexi bacterium]|nr:FHA domain-containing protein [Chloroflexota bacterium]